MDTENKVQNNQDYLLPASILIAGVLVAGAVIYSTGLKATGNVPTGDTGLEVVSGEALNLTAEDVILGDPNAPVTIIEYSDFQCPFCGRFYSQAESLIKENYIQNGKVKFVYRHFAFLGPESHAAAEAVECAKDQGKFWQYHDALFEAEIKDGQEHNGNLNRQLFVSLAQTLGLDTTEYAACLDGGKYAQKVDADYDGARSLGVQATPTVFVNGQKVEGALPYANFKILIDAELAK